MSGTVREVVPEDHAATLAIYAPFVRDTAVSFETEVPSAAAWTERIERTLARHPWLVFEEDGGVRGFASATSHRERAAYRFSAEVSTYVHPRARRRGVGRRLTAALLELLRLQGLRVALAGIRLPNPASVRLYESLGFESVGVHRGVGFKLGAWQDVGWWQRRLDAGAPGAGEPEEAEGGAFEPPEPRPWPALRPDPRVAQVLAAASEGEPGSSRRPG